MVPSVSRPTEKRFTTRRPSSRTRRRSVRLSPIAEDSSLLPPVGVWAVLNPSVAARPLRPATDRRPGEPLPHQLANRPQAPPLAPLGFLRTALPVRPYAGLARISAGCPPLKARLLTCSSPVRHAAQVALPASDLHVLRTPPALVLSQDQTRHQKFNAAPRRGLAFMAKFALACTSIISSSVLVRCLLFPTLQLFRCFPGGARRAIASANSAKESIS